MTSPFMRKILFGQEAVRPSAPVFTPTSAKAGKNPFMLALDRDNPEVIKSMGVNQPLRHPMFLGYRGDKAIYAGSRLFVLS